VKPAIAATLIITVLADQEAWAWGPVTHVAIGGSVLDSAAALPAVLAALLARHKLAYLYGCIAADIVFAKRLSKVKQFCHHWSTAFGLFEAGQDEEDHAFACGYLSHLAADTVAHGKYIPRQVALSGMNVNFGHLYWEIRADAAQPREHQRFLKSILQHDHGRHHINLASHITDTFLPYDLNRLFFDRMNAVAAHGSLVGRMDRMGKSLGGRLPQKLLEGYLSESVDRTLSVLIDGKDSPVLREDPNGTSALMQTKVQRRELKKLKRQGVSLTRRLRETSRALEPEDKRLVPLA
jgi:hypothetical protein